MLLLQGISYSNMMKISKVFLVIMLISGCNNKDNGLLLSKSDIGNTEELDTLESYPDRGFISFRLSVMQQLLSNSNVHLLVFSGGGACQILLFFIEWYIS